MENQLVFDSRISILDSHPLILDKIPIMEYDCASLL